MQSSQSSDLLWRLIPAQNATAGLNMAIDRYCLDAAAQANEFNHEQGKSDPGVPDVPDDPDDQKNWQARSMLRFYGWHRPTLSLGYHQRRLPEHWQNLIPALGLDLVRRPSGGRAVLHHHDLTYAIVTRAISPHRNVTYRHMCEFLIKRLLLKQIVVEITSYQRTQDRRNKK
jgi:lipoate-protein ligase A